MKVKVWIAITDLGDGSHSAKLFPSEENLRSYYELDEDDFSPNYDVPIEVISRTIETLDFEVVE